MEMGSCPFPLLPSCSLPAFALNAAAVLHAAGEEEEPKKDVCEGALEYWREGGKGYWC